MGFFTPEAGQPASGFLFWEGTVCRRPNSFGAPTRQPSRWNSQFLPVESHASGMYKVFTPLFKKWQWVKLILKNKL
jgi:hypothetical protein